jgi:hypothetical protein
MDGWTMENGLDFIQQMQYLQNVSMAIDIRTAWEEELLEELWKEMSDHVDWKVEGF